MKIRFDSSSNNSDYFINYDQNVNFASNFVKYGIPYNIHRSIGRPRGRQMYKYAIPKLERITPEIEKNTIENVLKYAVPRVELPTQNKKNSEIFVNPDKSSKLKSYFIRLWNAILGKDI